MSDRGKLGNFLKEVIHWRWDDFCRAEMDKDHTGFQATVFALVRVCSEGKLNAIRTAIDQVDGKLITPVRFKLPQLYYIYPYATSIANDKCDKNAPPESNAIVVIEQAEHIAGSKDDLATMSLRETLKKMADEPMAVVGLLLEKKNEAEAVAKHDGLMDYCPLVKSIIVANLLNLAITKNKFEAINEVFDQIDGKLVEEISMGEDMFLTQFSRVAPAGSIKNDEGIYIKLQEEATEQWRSRLKQD